MKILQIINNLGGGGAERLIADFVPLMIKMRYDVEVILLQREHSLYIDGLLEAGVKITVLTENGIYSPKNIFRVRKCIEKGNYDIVHVHLFPALYVVGLARILGCKVGKFIFTEHNTKNKRMANPLFRLADRWIYRQYDKIICITEAVRQIMRSHLSLPADTDKLVTVENGVLLERFDRLSGLKKQDIAAGVSDEDILIVMVARFGEQKDQATVVRAMGLLPLNYKLVLVGEGDLKPRIQKLAEELDLQDKVFFTGFRKDALSILKAADVAVLSSNWEGFGLAAVEAMGCGVPVIASDVEGLREVVSGAGLLFEKGNFEDLAEKVKLLTGNKEMYQRIADDCARRAKEFSMEKMVDMYIQVYKGEK